MVEICNPTKISTAYDVFSDTYKCQILVYDKVLNFNISEETYEGFEKLKQLIDKDTSK